MGDLVVIEKTPIAVEHKALPAMSEEAIGIVRQFETIARTIVQEPIVIEHLIHGGVYLRTVMLPAGTIITGALIKAVTSLIVVGHCTVYIGSEPMELRGYNVVPASAGRKQAFIAHKDTWLTMLFAAEVQDVDAAERYFTDEIHLLTSRDDPSLNRVRITGE